MKASENTKRYLRSLIDMPLEDLRVQYNVMCEVATAGQEANPTGLAVCNAIEKMAVAIYGARAWDYLDEKELLG